MSTPPIAPADRLQAQRILAGTVIGMPVILGVVSVVLYSLEDQPSLVAIGGFFLLNVLTFGAAEIIGYRTTAIDPRTDAETALRQGLDAMQQTMITRFAITEAPAILALVAATMTGSAWTYLVGAIWTVPSMIWHVWPSRRIAAKLERSLDREGGRSRLGELFGAATSPGYQQY